MFWKNQIILFSRLKDKEILSKQMVKFSYLKHDFLTCISHSILPLHAWHEEVSHFVRRVSVYLYIDILNIYRYCGKIENIFILRRSLLPVKIKPSYLLLDALSTILKHFRNAPLYILPFLPHGLVEDIFLVIFDIRVQ